MPRRHAKDGRHATQANQRPHDSFLFQLAMEITLGCAINVSLTATISRNTNRSAGEVVKFLEQFICHFSRASCDC
jgi:hypothetical protein